MLHWEASINLHDLWKSVLQYVSLSQQKKSRGKERQVNFVENCLILIMYVDATSPPAEVQGGQG